LPNLTVDSYLASGKAVSRRERVDMESKGRRHHYYVVCCRIQRVAFV
jgi:hypothetical protein